MHLKYFQSLHDIERFLDRALELKKYSDEEYPLYESKEQIEKDRKVLHYIQSLRFGYVRKGRGDILLKPTPEEVASAFNRILAQIEEVWGINDFNKKPTPYNELVLKSFKCAKYYIFKFSLTAWYEKLPNELYPYKNVL